MSNWSLVGCTLFISLNLYISTVIIQWELQDTQQNLRNMEYRLNMIGADTEYLANVKIEEKGK